MSKPPAETRLRIVEAAYELFYRRGFVRASVDDIAAAASLTKRTLYYHFESKDKLLASVLEMHAAMALARIRKHQDRYTGSADEMIEVLFPELAKWSTKPGWSGAGSRDL